MANNDGEDGYSYLPTLADELRDCGMPGEDEDDMSDVADLLFGAVPSATSGAGRASAATGAGRGRGRGRGRGNAAGAGAAGRGRGAPAVQRPALLQWQRLVLLLLLFLLLATLLLLHHRPATVSVDFLCGNTMMKFMILLMVRIVVLLFANSVSLVCLLLLLMELVT